MMNELDLLTKSSKKANLFLVLACQQAERRADVELCLRANFTSSFRE
jgi:hypothetical protein